MSKSIRNIALFAHVDAGKTSITESFLYLSGKIRQKGNVDHQNTQTDSLQVEKKRGISVKSGIVNFSWKNTHINLIDTPGHVDFSAETERSIMAIDGAIVILSAVEGLQAQAESIIQLLKKHQKPFLIFINKLDRMGADVQAVLDELKTDVGLNTVLLQKYRLNEQPKIEEEWNETTYQQFGNVLEQIVSEEESLFDKYISGADLSFDSLQAQLQEACQRQQLIPVLTGASKHSVGIEQLLDAVVQYLPKPENKSDNFSAIVFKTKHVEGEGKWVAVRVFGGAVQARETVYNATQQIHEKVKLIKNTELQNPEILTTVNAGEIAWIQGFKQAKPGDVLGDVAIDSVVVNTEKPLLRVQILPNKPSKINQLVEALHILNNEDPDLDFEYWQETQELHLKIRGQIQQEVLQDELLERFNIQAIFEEPTVIYKETPTKTAEGFVRYWMPKPCWAIMKFKIEPAPRGSGVHFESLVSVNDIKKQYQNDVQKTIPTALQQGILGWQVDDIKITLIEGEDHVMHTKSNDFAIATPMGIMDGLQKAEMTLLEPILVYKIKVPEKHLGLVAGELTKMRATIEGPFIENGIARIWGKIPLATSLQFPVKLGSLTGGKAKYLAKFSRYETCEVSLGKTRAYMGISPLDTAKYILKARKALS